MSDMVAWLNACYDRAEQKARAALGDADADPWTDPYGEFQSRGAPIFDHVIAHGPSWRLADIARKRKILAGHDGTHDCGDRRSWAYVGCATARLFAEEFSDQPGYREEWRP